MSLRFLLITIGTFSLVYAHLPQKVGAEKEATKIKSLGEPRDQTRKTSNRKNKSNGNSNSNKKGPNSRNFTVRGGTSHSRTVFVNLGNQIGVLQHSHDRVLALQLFLHTSVAAGLWSKTGVQVGTMHFEMGSLTGDDFRSSDVGLDALVLWSLL